jgi:hypothetical protein
VDPDLRVAIEKMISSKTLVARYRVDVDRVRAALKSSAPVARDPRSYVGETRQRGKKR